MTLRPPTVRPPVHFIFSPSVIIDAQMVMQKWSAINGLRLLRRPQADCWRSPMAVHAWISACVVVSRGRTVGGGNVRAPYNQMYMCIIGFPKLFCDWSMWIGSSAGNMLDYPLLFLSSSWSRTRVLEAACRKKRTSWWQPGLPCWGKAACTWQTRWACVW
jgi:hypothetical protein